MLPLLALALVGSSGTHQPASTSAAHRQFRPPNVIVVVLDDVGVDQFGVYGTTPAWNESHARTPVIDQLRAQGVLFERAWSSPLCSPSRAMLLTGRHGFRTGMLNLSETSGPCPPGYVFDGVNSCCPEADPDCLLPESTSIPPLHPDGYTLPDSEVTLAEALRDGAFPVPFSFASGAFGKWHLAGRPDDPCHPIRQGFEMFQGHLYNNEGGTRDHFVWERFEARTSSLGCSSGSALVQGEWDGERTQLDARAWIESVQAELEPRPFFAYVCFNPPHRPFQVPPRSLVSAQTWTELEAEALAQEGVVVEGVRSCQFMTVQETDSRRARLVYKAQLEAVDTLIGRLVFKGPSEPEVLENTLVFVVGDNGTPDQIYQATQDAGQFGASGAPYPPNRAKFQVYELGVHVPLIASGSGVAIGGTCASPVSLVDLWATIVDVAHVEVEGLVVPSELDSISFAPRLRRPTGPLATVQRSNLYTELASRNGMHYDRATQTWSPVAPSNGVTYQRALLDPFGFKYLRRIVGVDPGCTASAAFCVQPQAEEIFRLFDGATAVDPYEETSLCGDPAAQLELATLRVLMSATFSGQ